MFRAAHTGTVISHSFGSPDLDQLVVSALLSDITIGRDYPNKTLDFSAVLHMQSINKRSGIAAGSAVMALAAALLAGTSTPADAATSYSVSITPVIKPGGSFLGFPTGPTTRSVRFYSAASAQMKSISTQAVVRNLYSNALFYDTTASSASSNIKSLTWTTPSKYQSGFGYKATMTSKFTTKSGSVATKSTSKQWGLLHG